MKRFNPFKKIAALHNEGVDYVFKELKKRNLADSEINGEDLLDIVSEYMATITSTSNVSLADKAKHYEILAKILNKPQTNINDLIENVSHSNIYYDFTELLDLSEEMSHNDAIERLSSVEKRLLDSDYSDEDIKPILLFIAIAKGSIQNCDYVKFIFDRREAYDIHWPWKQDGEGAIHGLAVSVIFEPHITIAAIVGSAVYKSVETIIQER